MNEGLCRNDDLWLRLSMEPPCGQLWREEAIREPQQTKKKKKTLRRNGK